MKWSREAALEINPQDPLIASHVKPVLNEVYSAMHKFSTEASAEDMSNLRLCMHVVNSILRT